MQSDRIRILMIAMCFTLGVSAARAEHVTVFAAASLKTALDEIAAAFETASGAQVTLSYAGTSILARQISQGAPADIFISANTDWMDWLDARELLVADSRVDVTGNALVLITHDTSAAPLDPSRDSLSERIGTNRLAMALVDAVPAGIYGKAALTHFDLWEALAPLVAQTDNVRSALALVASGETSFGIVYASDAVAEPRVAVVATFPPESHPTIRYPAALLAAHASVSAKQFLDFIMAAPARRTFERHGFLPLDDPS